MKLDSSILVQGMALQSKAALAKDLVKEKSVLLITQEVDALAQHLECFELPSWETLPGEEIAPSPDIIGKRLTTLHLLRERKAPSIVLCPLQAFLQKVPKNVTCHTWKQGSKLAFDLLENLGYRRAAVVSDKGEYAIRGGIIDVFPVNQPDPYRIELFGNEVEEIRVFDPVSQKSVGKRESLFITEAKEPQEKLVPIFDYLDDPIVMWDDLLSLENAYVNLQAMPAFKSRFFTPLAELVKQVGKHVFCTDLNLNETFEMFGLKFKAKKKTFDYQTPDSDPQPIRRQKWRTASHAPEAEFHELTPGDLVVHFHSGIGRYMGMETQANHLGQRTEFLTLQYDGSAKLFVPLSQAYLVSRYIGSDESPPPLSELGSKRWQTIRQNAQKQVVGYANELLQLYAQRAVHGGFQYTADSKLVEEFENAFPYAATEDQILSVNALKEDMMSEKSMDRLICGDVGYGKTEVAMRAAFKAVVDGKKQVAVLVPTTVLAMQHFETFAERMKNFAVRVAIVSRFQTPKEVKNTLKAVEEGKVDVLVGTHRILSADVKFHDLGLVIVDEEQRFGVKAKEHLKKLRLGVDSLTLSATPIPRTLYMSLVHARDMSVIRTPPQDRLPVKTILAETDPELIQNAILREFARGGQVFYIHNRVESIAGRGDFLQKLIPSAKIGIVHGQMDADAIDAIFHRFKCGELNLLLATTIVENGVDVPNANTILIDRADTYGLADLYQLRGRVGRWNRAAYAYFLIQKNVRLPEIARKRLNALVEASGYGGGMKIAMRDLEIRGAGDILGIAQSGQVSAVGFHLYCKMLKRAIDALKKQAPISFNETRMEFPFDARLPGEYINEVSLRMEIYYRLGEAMELKEVDDLFKELIDRFGEPPMPVVWLYNMTRIRVVAASRGYTHLKFSNLSLTAEKPDEKKTILLPKKVQTPQSLEEYVVRQL